MGIPKQDSGHAHAEFNLPDDRHRSHRHDDDGLLGHCTASHCTGSRQ